LVQDPFGNYVVQYILDLAEPSFTNPLCSTFDQTSLLVTRSMINATLKDTTSMAMSTNNHTIASDH
jgi:hypothetical protein